MKEQGNEEKQGKKQAGSLYSKSRNMTAIRSTLHLQHPHLWKSSTL